jgi:hypothetical protein
MTRNICGSFLCEDEKGIKWVELEVQNQGIHGCQQGGRASRFALQQNKQTDFCQPCLALSS